MAIIHRATLTPGKPQLLRDWLPSQPWGLPAAEPLGAFRFDDPDGAVGVETILLSCGDGRLLHAPVTYRDAPLSGAERFLITTAEHSVLGTRWVYDGCGDPVYVRALLAVLLGTGGQAQERFSGTGELREPSVRVHVTGGTGGVLPPAATVVTTSDDASTLVRAGDASVVVHRRPVPDATTRPALQAAWDGADRPVLLAHLD